MKILTVVGARPQLIKAAAVSRKLRIAHKEVLVHTGQHYDENMSEVFFRELEIPKPDYNLGVGSGGHGAQTGAILAGIETVLIKERPDRVIVYGDTNSTLGGALAASKLHIPVVHIEAGLRSFNRKMPEEVNRVIVDHISDLCLCPSTGAVENLAREGIVKGVHLIGDVMYDALIFASEKAGNQSDLLKKLGLKDKKFILATVHRAENVDSPDRLMPIISALQELSESEPVVFPVHPRTKKRLESLPVSLCGERILFIDPVGYLDMVMLEKSARMILTDSGGIQKEAYWLKVPCIALRDETEWVETVAAGWNVLAGANKKKIINAAANFSMPAKYPELYHNGQAADKCVEYLT